MPIDPLSLAAGGVQALVGLGQTIFSGRKKAERQLNREIDYTLANIPKAQANKSILDYYNTALARYGVSPTDTAMYKSQMKGIDRGVATGLQSLQDRRSGIAGTSSILRASNDAKLNANVAAEQRRDNLFNQLGQATQMEDAERKFLFNQNEMLPWETRANLKLGMLGQKLQGANQRTNAGMQNIFGGFNTIASGITLGGGESNRSVINGLQQGGVRRVSNSLPRTARPII
jgi:hypothetical protein